MKVWDEGDIEEMREGVVVNRTRRTDVGTTNSHNDSFID